MKKYNTKPISSFVEEPEVFYGLANKYDKIVSILGGSSSIGATITNDIDLISISRKGLPKSVVILMSTILSISMEKMSHLIHVSHRTLQRKNPNDLLSTYSTEQILEIAEVISRGIEVFGSLPNFTKWLHSNIKVFQNHKPIDYLDTSFGTQLILNTLGRIEYGVYS